MSPFVFALLLLVPSSRAADDSCRKADAPEVNISASNVDECPDLVTAGHGPWGNGGCRKGFWGYAEVYFRVNKNFNGKTLGDRSNEFQGLMDGWEQDKDDQYWANWKQTDVSTKVRILFRKDIPPGYNPNSVETMRRRMLNSISNGTDANGDSLGYGYRDDRDAYWKLKRSYDDAYKACNAARSAQGPDKEAAAKAFSSAHDSFNELDKKFHQDGQPTGLLNRLAAWDSDVLKQTLAWSQDVGAWDALFLLDAKDAEEKKKKAEEDAAAAAEKQKKDAQVLADQQGRMQKIGKSANGDATAATEYLQQSFDSAGYKGVSVNGVSMKPGAGGMSNVQASVIVDWSQVDQAAQDEGKDPAAARAELAKRLGIVPPPQGTNGRTFVTLNANTTRMENAVKTMEADIENAATTGQPLATASKAATITAEGIVSDPGKGIAASARGPGSVLGSPTVEAAKQQAALDKANSEYGDAVQRATAQCQEKMKDYKNSPSFIPGVQGCVHAMEDTDKGLKAKKAAVVAAKADYDGAFKSVESQRAQRDAKIKAINQKYASDNKAIMDSCNKQYDAFAPGVGLKDGGQLMEAVMELRPWPAGVTQDKIQKADELVGGCTSKQGQLDNKRDADISAAVAAYP
jgi:hypothetical protein